MWFVGDLAWDSFGPGTTFCNMAWAVPYTQLLLKDDLHL